MRVAVEGCCHGELDNIYATAQEAAASDGVPVDLLLICGDFQALRNFSDMQSLACPEKYRHMGGFYRYYSGERVAPMLTIVIGGNHEASNYMWELFHGGWLAPNIYFLGAAGSVLVNGLRISGASGIYKSNDYRKGRFETLPYDRSSIRSVYHTREYDIARLAQLALLDAYPTIFLSHDWPLQIERYGDTPALVRRKPFFREEIESNTLGSPPLRGLLEILKPAYWFAAHLHVKFSALFKHDKSDTLLRGNGIPPLHGHQPPRSQPRNVNPDELLIDDEGDMEADTMPQKQTTENPDELNVDIDDEDAAEAQASPSAIVTNPMNGTVEALEAAPEDLVHPSKPLPGLTDALPVKGIDESVMAVSQTEATNGEANTDEIAIEDEDANFELAQAHTVAGSTEGSIAHHNQAAAQTRFLALSKCLPGQDFLQVFDIPVNHEATPPKLTFDPQWLAITRAFHPLLSLSIRQESIPHDPATCKAMVVKELAWVRQNVQKDELEVEVASIQQFQPTAPHPGQPGGEDRRSGPWYTNPQTEAFCKMLGIENKANPVPPELR